MTPAELEARERRVRARELTVAAREAELGMIREDPISLPAEPAADALRTLLQHHQFGDGDLQECARGLGVDANWLGSLVHGDRPTLDATDVATVCEALQCTPYALWPADLARQTLEAYPPERWPARTAPLEDLLATDNAFMARRIEQQAAEIVSLGVVPQRLEPTEVRVTPYRIDGVVAVHEHGGAIVTATQLHDVASAHYDYFFTFSQLRDEESTVAYLHRGVLEDAPPPGAAAPPDLVRLANDLAAQTPGTDAVEFRDPSGTVHWVGRAPGTTVWESWSDPAGNFPGDRDMVIHRSDELRFERDLRLACSLVDSGAFSVPSLDDL